MPPRGWFPTGEMYPCGRPRFDPWVRKIPWRRKWQPTSVCLPGKSHRWKSLAGYSPRGHKDSANTTERLQFQFQGFPGGSDGKERKKERKKVKLLSCVQRLSFDPWVRKIPSRREWQATPVLPGKFHEQRSLVQSMGSQSWAQ